MKSLGARLTFWYAVVATTTVALLFLIGRYLLELHLVHGLDLLMTAKFEEVRSRLGPSEDGHTPATLDARLRHDSDLDAALFYVQVHAEGGEKLFSSANLGDTLLPDLPGRFQSWTVLPFGEIRLAEFFHGRLHVQIATPLAQVEELMRGYVRVSSTLIGVILVVSIILGHFLSRIALQPVRAIQETANRIRVDHLSERIPVPNTRDEISDLARLLNRMFDRLEASFGQVRRFTAEASHELKTPLSLVKLQAEKLLTRGDLTPEQESAVSEQLEEIARLNTIIENLLLLAKAEAGALPLQVVPQRAERFLHDFVEHGRALADDRGVQLTLGANDAGEVPFDANWLRQVLFNLLANALRAAPAGSTITLHSRFVGATWRVEVVDEGAGVPAAQLERIFDRFVRLQPSGGTGLGLAICRSIVELHRGRIFAENREDRSGLRVIWELPAHP